MGGRGLSELERTKSSERESRTTSEFSREEEEEYYEGTSLPGGLGFQKEGLPPDFRMRHDDHYVQELVASGRMPQLRLLAVSEIQGGPPLGGESLDALIDSVQEFGVLQPLLVRRDRGRYELLAGSKRLAAARNAGLKEVPCLVHEVDDVDARRLAEAANRPGQKPASGLPAVKIPWGSSASALIDGSLSTILSTLGLLERPEGSLRDHVAIGLIRTEALKATRLLRGLQLLGADPPVVRSSIDVGALLNDVLDSYEDERGLLAIEIEKAIERGCTIRGDEELARLALAGAVESVMALLRASRGAKLHVQLTRNELMDGITLVVSEEAVRLPTASWSSWFDLSWERRPGGYAAGVSLLAAKRVAELHGGRLEMAPTDSGGCRLTLLLPSH